MKDSTHIPAQLEASLNIAAETPAAETLTAETPDQQEEYKRPYDDFGAPTEHEDRILAELLPLKQSAPVQHPAAPKTTREKTRAKLVEQIDVFGRPTKP